MRSVSKGLAVRNCTQRIALFVAIMGFCSQFEVMAGTDASPEAIGKIIAIEAEATVTRNESDKVKLEMKSPVYLQDRITTSKAGKIQILFKDDTILSIGPNSETILDEYIYSPEKKEECSMGISAIKGVFRTVTGKITELNPDRFKVKTRMATIGIRGTDIFYQINGLLVPGSASTQPRQGRQQGAVDDEGLKVAVVEASHEQDVTVTLHQDLPKNKSAGAGSPRGVAPVVIRPGAGEVVTITPDRAPKLRELRAAEIRNFVKVTTPKSLKPVSDPMGAAPKWDPSTRTVSVDDGSGGESHSANNGDSDGKDDDSSLADDAAGDSGTLDVSTDTSTGATGDSSIYANTLFERGDPLVVPEPPPEPEPEPEPDPEPVTKPKPLDGYVVEDSGLNWDWGIWYVTGEMNNIDHNNFNQVPDTDLIIAGGTIYNLTGAGKAGALVQESSAVVGYLKGSVTVDISVGGGNQTCDFAFSLAGDGGTADMAGIALIQTDGSIQMTYLDFSSYTFVWKGTTYGLGDLDTGTWLDGSLVGPGLLANPSVPITGIVGGFDMIHFGTTAPTLSGEYGADVN